MNITVRQSSSANIRKSNIPYTLTLLLIILYYNPHTLYALPFSTCQKNRIEKFLQSSGFRLPSLVSDIFGDPGRNIIRYLIEHGQINRNALDSCLKTQTRKRIDEILISVNRTLSDHQKHS